MATIDMSEPVPGIRGGMSFAEMLVDLASRDPEFAAWLERYAVDPEGAIAESPWNQGEDLPRVWRLTAPLGERGRTVLFDGPEDLQPGAVLRVVDTGEALRVVRRSRGGGLIVSRAVGAVASKAAAKGATVCHVAG